MNRDRRLETKGPPYNPTNHKDIGVDCLISRGEKWKFD